MDARPGLAGGVEESRPVKAGCEEWVIDRVIDRAVEAEDGEFLLELGCVASGSVPIAPPQPVPREPPQERGGRRAIPRRNVEEMIGRDKTSCARHVPRNDRWTSRYIFSKITRDQPCVDIWSACGRIPDDKIDRLTPIEFLDGLSVC